MVKITDLKIDQKVWLNDGSGPFTIDALRKPYYVALVALTPIKDNDPWVEVTSNKVLLTRPPKPIKHVDKKIGSFYTGRAEAIFRLLGKGNTLRMVHEMYGSFYVSLNPQKNCFIVKGEDATMNKVDEHNIMNYIIWYPCTWYEEHLTIGELLRQEEAEHVK